MDRHIIEQQVTEYGRTFLGFGKDKQRCQTVKFLLPNGERSESLVSNWRNGHRPGGQVGRYTETFFDRNPEAGNAPGLIYYLKITHPTLPTFYPGLFTKAGGVSGGRWV
jgi:hypothetical protein